MADKNWRIRVSADGAEAAAAKLGIVDRSIGGIAMSAAKLAAGYFGTAGLINALKYSTEQAREAEAAEKKLDFAYKGNTDSLKAFAQQMMRMKNVDDDAVVAQEAYLASLKFSERQIKSIISAAADLSAQTGGDLASSVEALSRSFTGQGRQLGALVPQVKSLTESQLRHGEAVRVVADLLEGKAAEAMKTTSGQMDAAKISFDNAAQALGETLTPAIAWAAGQIKEMSDTWAELIANLERKKPTSLVTLQQEAARLKLEMEDISFRTSQPINFMNWVTEGDVAWLTTVAKTFREQGSAADANRVTAYALALKAVAEEEARIAAMRAKGKGEGPADLILPRAGEEAAADGAYNRDTLLDALREKVHQNRLARFNETSAALQKESDEAQAAHDAEAKRQQEVWDANLAARELRASDAEWIAEVMKKEADLAKLKKDTVKAGVGAALGSMAQLNAAAKGNATMSKRLAQAEAIWNTANAATAALKNPPGPPWTIPMFIATLAMGAAQVATIQAQQFASGGWVDGHGGSRSDSVPARLSSGERVLSAREIALMGGRGAVDAIARGGGGGNVINLTVNGPIDQQWWSDVAIPQLTRAWRLSA